jgi:hypothetical protein
VSTPNEKLVAARLRTSSPSSSGTCLSRQELAELINATVYRQTGKVVAVDHHWIGRLERGDYSWPREDYRAALRAIFGVTSDASLGFTNSRQQLVEVGVMTDIERRKVLRAAGVGLGAVALAPLIDMLGAAEATAAPSRIGATEIKQVYTAAEVFKSWDSQHGGGLARETVLAQLQWSAGLLDSTCPQTLRPDLHSAVAYLASVHGFMCFDAYAFDDARRSLQFGVACAETGGNWSMRAEILSRLARQEIYTGHPDDGLTWIEQALVRADRLTATERAMLHTVRGRALAKLNRAKEALRSIGVADDWFSQRKPAEDPTWLAYYDAAQHAGDTGHGLFDLSMKGVKTEAEIRLASAANNHQNTFVRSKAFSRIKLATLEMATGDPRRAVEVGNEVLTTAGEIHSRRVADLMRDLGRSGARHGNMSEVADLQERIRISLVAS